MENEKMKELEATIDSYGIQLLLMKAQFATLEGSLMNLANFILTDEERANFLKNHFDTLISNSHALNTPHDLPFSRSNLVKQLIELELYAKEQLKKL